jgi:histone H3/H4
MNREETETFSTRSIVAFARLNGFEVVSRSVVKELDRILTQYIQTIAKGAAGITVTLGRKILQESDVKAIAEIRKFYSVKDFVPDVEFLVFPLSPTSRVVRDKIGYLKPSKNALITIQKLAEDIVSELLQIARSHTEFCGKKKLTLESLAAALRLVKMKVGCGSGLQKIFTKKEVRSAAEHA